MRDQHTREIVFYDSKLIADPSNDSLPSMFQIGEILKRLCDARTTDHWTKTGNKKFSLQQCKVDYSTSTLRLLVTINDAHGPSASFANLKTNSHRHEAKREGEGRPESCHIMFLVDQNGINSEKYLTLVESSNLANRYYVQLYLNKLLRFAQKSSPQTFVYPDPSGAQSIKHLSAA